MRPEHQHDKVTPYNSPSSKKEQVGKMFDNIAHRYDLLNRVLSGGIDQVWRKRVTNLVRPVRPKHILDMATGTADLAIMMAQKLDPEKVIGLDISNQMLNVGREKVTRRKLNEKIELNWGDAESIDFPDGYFDAITVAFGVRNFQDLDAGIAEMTRVLRKGGKLVVLEFTRPRLFGFRHLYDFYFKYVLPVIGKWTSKDPKAYQYLYESVQAFPDYENFVKVLEDHGLNSRGMYPQTLGICCIYEAEK